MDLTPLEEDFISDLAEDNFALYEVSHNVRAFYPEADELEVLRRAKELVATWIERGWLEVSDVDGTPPPGGVNDLLRIMDEQGPEGTRYFDDAPWLTLAPKARQDVEWLRPDV